MIPRYTHPDMGRIWSEERRFETWLQVEIAAAEAMAEAGIIPHDAARDIRERSKFDVARIAAIEETTQHDVIAFTTAVAEHVGPVRALAALRPDLLRRRRYRAGAFRCARRRDLLIKDVEALLDAVRARAEEHRAHADDRPHPRRACRADDVRAEAGALVRGAAARPGAADARARGRRGGQDLRRGRDVRPSRSVDRSRDLPQARAGAGAGVVAGDSARPPRRAADGASRSRARRSRSSRSRFAGLQKTEIGEVQEPFGKGQKGSSAMPHKRNPIGCEQITGLARLLRGNAHAALENIALWHERDISHSSVERVILPDSFIALDHMLRRFTRIVKGLVVNRRSHAAEPRAVARRGVLRNRAPRAGAARHFARTGLRVGAAQCAALVRRAERLQAAAARRRGRDGACSTARPSTMRSI